MHVDITPLPRDGGARVSCLSNGERFMFTRSSSAEPRPAVANAANGSWHQATGPESTEKSVIGNDLKIVGQGLKILGRGVLQVDGEIEGDVQAAEVIVGEKGQVTGMVAGRQV